MRRRGLLQRNPVCAVALAMLAIAISLDACTSQVRSPGSTSKDPAPTSPSSNNSVGGGRARPLPLAVSPGDSTQVITVVSNAASASTAMLQTWEKGPRADWIPVGGATVAHVGSAGITAHEREGLAATPAGSFTLTQAFGRLRNPGTRLPYFQTTPNDWWISQAGSLYNTHQKCISGCPFIAGSPNAQVFYVSPQYDLVLVIDYNRFPVIQGAGSGVFLHVTRGRPTAGCVSIDAAEMVRIMRWLQPQDHPRILIGVGRPKSS